MKRSSGVLLHISSLPSRHGIGTLGDEACKFADRLSEAGQKYWQILPINPTGYGDSPYQSVSVFAGNPYFIDLDLLCEGGLIPKEVLSALDEKEGDPRRVDYARLYETRYSILRIAYAAEYRSVSADVEIFRQENAEWIDDFALFMACKNHFEMKPWYEWDDKDIRMHTPLGIEKYTELLYDDICFYTYVQYLFFRQYRNFKNYANSVGVSIIGDMPMYVAYDSSDVWANPKNYLLDRDNKPKWVAGVPPDYFSSTGQLWGNPLYNYKRMRRDSYSFWLSRMAMAARLYDCVRIDHFRGLAGYFCIPYGDKDATGGHWEKGPGMSLIRAIREKFPDFPIIAEDLGILTDDVRKLLSDSGFPGMRILQFAFYDGCHSTYQPHVYPRNTVCYTGTHDNDTLSGYIDSLSPNDMKYATRYMGLNSEEGVARGIIRTGMASVADLFIAQMQDYLGLGSEYRMNTPSNAEGNWQFRMLDGEFTDDIVSYMRELSYMYER